MTKSTDDGSFTKPVLSATLEEAVAKQDATYPPSGLSPEELRIWLENQYNGDDEHD